MGDRGSSAPISLQPILLGQMGRLCSAYSVVAEALAHFEAEAEFMEVLASRIAEEQGFDSSQLTFVVPGDMDDPDVMKYAKIEGGKLSLAYAGTVDRIGDDAFHPPIIFALGASGALPAHQIAGLLFFLRL